MIITEDQQVNGKHEQYYKWTTLEEEIDNMNCPIAMKILIINLKAPRIWNLLDGFPGELYQTEMN